MTRSTTENPWLHRFLICHAGTSAMRVSTNALAGKCVRFRGHGDNYRRGARHLSVALNHAVIPRDEAKLRHNTGSRP